MSTTPSGSRQVEVELSADECATAAGITTLRLTRLVRLGLVEPLDAEARRFSATTVARLRRMMRLRSDLGVNLVGAAIIVDLLARLDDLERGR